VVEVIGIIIILVKVLIPMVIDGAVLEEDFPKIEVVVFAVSYSSKKQHLDTQFFIGRGGGASGSDSFRDSDDRGKFELNKWHCFTCRFFFQVVHIVVIKVVLIVAIAMVPIAVLVAVRVVHRIIHHIKRIQEKKIQIKNLKNKQYLLINYLYAPMRTFFFLFFVASLSIRNQCCFPFIQEPTRI